MQRGRSRSPADLDRGYRSGKWVRFGAPLFASTFWSPYGFNVKMLWWLGLTLVAAWVLARTRFGNWIFGAGGDPVAARNVGVPVARTKILLFMTTSATAAACWGS